MRMPKTSTHFEQIPVEVVKKIAIRQRDHTGKVGAVPSIRRPASQKPERDPTRRRRLADGTRRLQRLAPNRTQAEIF
jgi:hypothetical protein